MNRSLETVIIGGIAAGTAAAAAISRHRPDYSVTICEAGPYISVANCCIPEFLDGTFSRYEDLVHFSPADFQEKYGVKIRTFHRVEQVDLLNRTLSGRDYLSGKPFKLNFDRLVIATGAAPVSLNVAGASGTNVFRVKSLDEAIALKEYIKTFKPRTAVVVGAGSVGLVMADCLRRCGLSTTVLEKNANILPRFDEALTHQLVQTMEKSSIKIMTDQNLEGYEKDSEGTVTSVSSSGTSFSCDLVIEAVGVKPDVQFFKSMGLRTDRSGALIVDQTMRTSHNLVYAAGDCVALNHYVSSKPGYFPLGSLANRGGRVAGENIAGRLSRLKGVVATTMIQIQGVQVGITGLCREELESLGLHYEIATIQTGSRVAGYEGSELLTIRLYTDTNGYILGTQLAGLDGVNGRLQTFALAIEQKLNVKDLILTDFGYTPHLSPPWDPINIAARAAMKKNKG